MNNQEAIEKILKNNHTKSGLDFDDEVRVATVIDIINQIDEPQKPVIPQFVADWVEKCKEKDGYTLSDALSPDVCPMDLDRWFYLDGWENENLFAQAWLFGYEIEQEQLYTVEIPNNDRVSLMLIKDHEHIRLGYSNYVKKVCASSDGCTYKLTESEIRKDFEWAWHAGFAKEVE